jgi:hypothetical protein
LYCENPDKIKHKNGIIGMSIYRDEPYNYIINTPRNRRGVEIKSLTNDDVVNSFTSSILLQLTNYAEKVSFNKFMNRYKADNFFTTFIL